MTPFPFIFVLTLVANNSSYPEAEVLEAFGRACPESPAKLVESSTGPAVKRAVEGWQQSARNADWTLVTTAEGSLDQTFLAQESILFNSQRLTYTNDSDYVGRAIFKKLVAGRSLYLSIAGFTDQGETTSLAECRVHDPSAQKFGEKPISQSAIKNWIGPGAKRTKSLFGGQSYGMKGKFRSQFAPLMHIHFGTRLIGKPFKANQIDDIYALTGVTIVRGYSEQIILI